MTTIDIHIEHKAFPAQGRMASHTVLQDLHLRLEDNEFVCLVGPSGCGKTTLLNLIAGLDSEFKGRIDFHQPRPPRLSYVFQEPRLLPWRTVRENLELALPSGKQREIIPQLLEVAELTPFQHAYPQRLSLGMSRRVALVRAFAAEADLLLMDEPFVSLDPATASKMRRLALELWHQRPHTVLFVTHDLREAIALADRVVFLTSPPTRAAREFSIPLARSERTEAAVAALYRTLGGEKSATP
jgi:NitT/TauT family transport system ATP-binding protein